MDKTALFDVLVVYTQRSASSASLTNVDSITPFSLSPGKEHYGPAYAYFLEKCRQQGLSAAFTTSADIIGPGLCNNYWMFEKNEWKKVIGGGFSKLIFDKVSPLRRDLRETRNLLFSEGVSHPFNDISLHILFNDKLKTFKKLRNFTIPTVNITSKNVTSSIKEIEKLVKNHKNRDDFSKSLVLKDRFGAGGINIYKINKNPEVKIAKIIRKTPGVSYVLQPFTKFDRGYSYKNNTERTDIRIIYSQGKVVQRYIRTAKVNDFRCNEHQGGKVKYISAKDVPGEIMTVSDLILEKIDGQNALFAMDFIVSNNGNVYFLEGNINPGLYWGINSIEDKVNTKKLIRIIVKELKRRSDLTSNRSTNPLPKPILPLQHFASA